MKDDRHGAPPGGPAMRAAIYVRLSKEDRDAARAGVESCQMQEHNARAAISAQAWCSEDGCVFLDDDISGAEIVRRPALQAMLAAAERGAFDIVVLRDLDRLARDAARQAALLVRLADARVRVWSYVDSGFAGLAGYEYLLTAVKGVVAEQERAKAAQRIREALRFRAKEGLATRAARYGYRIAEGKDGRKRLAIDPNASCVVLLIGETFVETGSLRATAIRLNDRGIASPRGGKWGPASIGNILRAPMYRGAETTHGARRTVYEGGTAKQVRAPAADVLMISRRDLKIWPDELLTRIDEKLAALPKKFAGGAATPKHLASSFIKCGLCQGGVTALGSKLSGSASYVCNRCNQKGKSACPGFGYRAERRVDEALLKAIAPLVGSGEVAERAMAILAERIKRQMQPEGRASQRQCLSNEITKSEAATKNLAKAIAAGGEMVPLVEAMRAETEKIGKLRGELARLATPKPASLDARRLLQRTRERLDELAGLHAKGGIEARPVLQALLGDAKFTALPIRVNGEKRLQLTAEISGGYLLSNVVQSPSGLCPSFPAPFGSPWPWRPRRPSARVRARAPCAGSARSRRARRWSRTTPPAEPAEHRRRVSWSSHARPCPP
jgi:site-specific DNA recombinase